MAEELACRNCKFIITHGDVCPICGSKDLTDKWNGYIIIINVDKSEIAQKEGFKVNGTYAINIKD